jgi:hypothetical protein
MKTLLMNMSPRELVMTIMGIIIFLVLVFLLVWQVIKQKPYYLLLIGFLIPLILVGYPTIQSMEFDKWKFKIITNAERVNANPGDTTARAQLEKAVDSLVVDPRTKRNPEALATLATAQLSLGNLTAADSAIKKASELAPESGQVKTVAAAVMKQRKINSQFLRDVNFLNQQIMRIQEKPEDSIAVNRVIETMSNLQAPRYVDESSAMVIAKSYAVLKRPSLSRSMVNQVFKSDSASTHAQQLKKENMALKQAYLTPSQKRFVDKNLNKNVIGNQSVIK